MARKKKEKAPEKKEQAKPPVVEETTMKVKVTPEELDKLQNEGKLLGYDPATCEAVIRKGE